MSEAKSTQRARRKTNRGRLVARDGYIRGDGADIYFKSVGNGRPLVVLHGGPGSDHTDFLPSLRPLARQHRLIFIDERGSGRSERLQDTKKYTLDYMVNDLHCVRKHLGLKRFALLGHSFGGLLAQAYAIRYPTFLSRLILAGTAHSAKIFNADFRKIRNALPPRVRAKMKAYESRGIFGSDGRYVRGYETLCAGILSPYMYSRPPPPAEPQSYVSGWEVLREMWVRRSDFRVDGNLKGLDFTSKLKTLQVPTLVVLGDHDLVSVKSAEALTAALPKATLSVIPDCGHMMYIDQTQRFNALVSNFLDSRYPAASTARNAKRQARKSGVVDRRVAA
jgi:proline iminopeptidase